MRSFLVGLLLLALASASFGQVRGEVESIGFGDGWFRPQCWTPMVVRLQSQISEPAEYRIEVHQHDLDFDHVIYVKDGITLNAQATQRWELCFLPEPIHGGLPEGSIRDLQDRLRVYLTNKQGTRQLIQLPITSSVQSLEASAGVMGFGVGKANKLVLAVSDGSSRMSLGEYEKAIGLVERPEAVPVRPSDLPQSPLAYQAVDAVVWLSGDAHVLSEQGSTQFTALQQWVRQGGTLIVCQPDSDADRPKIEPFADMLPIEWKVDGQWKVSVQSKDTLEPLIRLAAKKESGEGWPPSDWHLTGPFAFARATPKPNAVVDAGDWIDWDAKGQDRTPYIARGPYGLGCVTWVAQDLGNPRINTDHTPGWAYVWSHVFGWANEMRVVGDRREKDEDNYAGGEFSDLGSVLNKGVEFGAKGTGLIALAVVFFIIYWIVAGPGSYLFLAGKKRKEMSWAAFGAAALGATLLTVVLVRLVLRGNPELHHATDLRLAVGQEAQPAIAISKLGMYIPRDGDQRLSLPDVSNEFASYIAPLSVLPAGGENDFPANLDYQIPIPDAASGEGVSVDVPFRSTLKKLQAHWTGDTSKTVRGNGVQFMLHANNLTEMLKGSLDNLTGVDLHNVYIAFHDPSKETYSGQGTDYVIFVPSWPASGAGARLDLTNLLQSPKLPPGGGSGGTNPGPDSRCWGDIQSQWSFYWHYALQPNGVGGSKMVDDYGANIPASFPVLSLFDRIPPAKKTKDPNIDPYTLLRRGARNLNMSPAVAAGEMVVLAQADNQPLPYTLDVNGDKVAGSGTVFYQFALPIERVAPAPPPVATTKP